MSDTWDSQRNPYLVSIHPQANFSTSQHGEVDLHTNLELPGFLKRAKAKAQETYEKSGMSWKSSAQIYWDNFIDLIPDPKTEPNLSQQQQQLPTFESYENLNEIDRSTKLWLEPKQDPRTLTDRERKFLTENKAKLNEQQIEWLKRELPKMKSSWSQVYHDHYLPERNTGFESQRKGDRRENYPWMRVKYPKTLDFILQILEET